MNLFWGFGLQRQTVKFREVKQINMIWILYDPDKSPAVCSEFKCIMNPMPEQELCSPIRRDIGTLYRFDGVMNLCISNPADKHMYYLPLECLPLTDAATSNWSLLSSSFKHVIFLVLIGILNISSPNLDFVILVNLDVAFPGVVVGAVSHDIQAWLFGRFLQSSQHQVGVKSFIGAICFRLLPCWDSSFFDITNDN